jgi:hypothetical protein
MIKRSVGAMVVGSVVTVGAAIASCSFPTYNITVTGSGGASASVSSGAVGSGGHGGSGGASTTASSGSVGGAGGASASSGSAGGNGGAGGASSGTTTAASSSTGTCSTDEDGDGAVSWECGGPDCADQDNRAHPGADFTPGAAIKGPLQPGILPYDFNCDFSETKKTLKITCPGVCLTPVMSGFQNDVPCGASGIIGHCDGGLACGWVSDSTNTTEICK